MVMANVPGAKVSPGSGGTAASSSIAMEKTSFGGKIWCNDEGIEMMEMKDRRMAVTNETHLHVDGLLTKDATTALSFSCGMFLE